MRKLSKRTQYSLRALYELARNYGAGPILISNLSAPALFLAFWIPALAQDDVTTQHAASSYAGGYITGPASNPLSFLNGPAYRTFGTAALMIYPISRQPDW